MFPRCLVHHFLSYFLHVTGVRPVLHSWHLSHHWHLSPQACSRSLSLSYILFSSLKFLRSVLYFSTVATLICTSMSRAVQVFFLSFFFGPLTFLFCLHLKSVFLSCLFLAKLPHGNTSIYHFPVIPTLF